MNAISRSLTRVVYSSLHHSRTAAIPRRKWVISQQIRFNSSAISGKAGGGGRKPRAKGPSKPPEVAAAAAATMAEQELARPREIAYQSEVANWVNLIGFVDQPVQFEASSDGKFWAGTVISQRSGSHSSAFWIPIIFEGELAQIAARYLKKDDQIHISGKLFIDSPPPNVMYAQANVQNSLKDRRSFKSLKRFVFWFFYNPALSCVHTSKVTVQNLNFVQATSPAMTNSSSEKEEGGIKKRPAVAMYGTSQTKKVTDEALDSWKDLLDNPKEWWDYRDNKAKGLIKPRHPDFKHKGGSLSLWLNKAPDWVLSKLEGLKFDVPVSKPKEVKHCKGEESWKDLVQNPDKWWDNRAAKKNVKAPDFKHKETGEALWLNDSPTWVLSKLPPLQKKEEATTGKNGTEPC